MPIKPTFTMPTYDYTSLSSFYSTGAFMGATKHADVLKNGVLKDILSIDRDIPVPPWKIRRAVEGNIVDRVFSGKPLIDKSDPLFERTDVDDNFKNLFALYKGLYRLEDIASYAKTNEGNVFAALLKRQFDIHVQEVKDFLKETLFTDLSIVSGLKSEVLRSTISIPPVTDDNAYIGGKIATDKTSDIPGLSTSDTFNIDVTLNSTTTSVTVNMSDAASLSLNDVIAQINTDLAAAGFGSTAKSRHFEGPSDESSGYFAIQFDFASGEEISLSHGASAESKSVYIAGRSGSGDLANGFLVKVDDLDASDPSQVFYTGIDSKYDGSFHGDTANGVAVDSKGHVYTVGSTSGEMEGQINLDGSDIFLNKYDASGNLLFSRMLGSNESATGFKVAVDSDDNVVIAGQTGGALTNAAYDSGLDNFITKFDSDGEELWTRQLGPFATDAALDITFDSSGNIYASGLTFGAISSDQTYTDGSDAYVTKLDSDGTLVFNKQFSGTGNDRATAIAINGAGDILVAGITSSTDGFLRKYDSSGNLSHDTSLGTIGSDGDITGIAIDSNDDVYISGYSSNAALSGTVTNAHSGGTDGFVLHVDDQASSASINYVAYVGTSSTDKSFGVAVDTSDNSFYVTGSTEGTLSGETSSAAIDAYLAKFDSAGALAYTHQFGSGMNNQGFDIAFDSDGSNTLSKLGLSAGVLPVENSLTVGSRTSVRADQVFYISVNGSESKVTIESDDTFGYLAFKINKILGIQGRASLDESIDQRVFQIEALNGAKIEIRKGPGNFDALPGLGMVEKTLFGTFEEGDRVGELSADDKAFGLGLIGSLSVLTIDKASETLVIVENAMREIRSAHKFLNEGLEDEDEFKVPGRASAYAISRIAAFEATLAAVQGMRIRPLTSISLKI